MLSVLRILKNRKKKLIKANIVTKTLSHTMFLKQF